MISATRPGKMGALVLLAIGGGFSSATADEKPVWAESLDAARASARKQDKLVFVAVSYGQCGWCQKMERTVYPDPKVIAALKGYVPVHERVGLGPKGGKDVMLKSAFAENQKTALTPTFYVLDPAGGLVDTFATFQAAPELVDRLTRAERDYREFPDLAKHVKAKPRDHVAVGRYAAMLAARGRVADAVALVEQAERAGAGAELAPAYNRIADTQYQALFGGACELYGSFETYDKGTTEAIRWFKKTLAASKDPAHVAYARYGLATCLGKEGKQEAQTALYDEILAMPDAPAMIKGWVEARHPQKNP